ncbi:MAG: MgtC/SapB family protein [Clostridium celatum]|uniref:Mg2+ transporter-C family protein n=2 Tax=Clostridium celatum TaxID=36834 RepID=L1QCQ3_9CLOT|nr:Mg2+ transporter-C family protein [Clostridium celatum DSM 1785]MDU2266414.1 MgtC/SapB family protein [Clostridium celatum]MDU6296724.1 MgtC/SapB family protein [Clostridium celatum]
MVVGIRTHVMVGLVGLLIQITSLEYYRVNGGSNDVFRLAGQYISGIGFLGAGTILKDKRSIKGLTTAASICLAAIIGLAVGSGIYISSIVITIVAYAFLNDIFKIKKLIIIKKNSHAHIEVGINGNIAISVENIKEMIRSSGADIISIEVRKEAEKRVNLRFKINLDDELDISDVLTDIVSIDEVDKVELIEHQ